MALLTAMTGEPQLSVGDVDAVEAELKAMGHESLATPGNGTNWVERVGQLPAYIQHIAKDLHEKRGMPLSRAIATAISRCKVWAAGGGGVKPDTQAKAAAAIAEWEALKARAHAKADPEPSERKSDSEDPLVAVQDDELVEIKTESLPPRETKADKAAALLSTDDATGTVEAIVSVTEIEDRVGDVIHKGAYDLTDEPIGVWSHDDKTWCAIAEEVKELPPGDPMLPPSLPNGQAWPLAAGGLYVKHRYNLETTAGRDAYSNVKFFQGKTGWSIGYQVKKAFRDTRTGVRHIKSLVVREFSPVMVGAASQAMTLSVKSLGESIDPDEHLPAAETVEDEAKADSGYLPCPKCGSTKVEMRDGKGYCAVDGTKLTAKGAHAEAPRMTKSLVYRVAAEMEDLITAVDSCADEVKAGRVLSAANVTAIRGAYDQLGAVLRTAGALDTETKTDPVVELESGTETVPVEMPAKETVDVPVADPPVADPPTETKSALSLSEIHDREMLRFSLAMNG